MVLLGCLNGSEVSIFNVLQLPMTYSIWAISIFERYCDANINDARNLIVHETDGTKVDKYFN